MLYKAWIPNVSGTLSFTNIKGNEIPNRAKAPLTFNNLTDEEFPYIYSIQERNLSDEAWPRSNGNLLYLLKASIKNRWSESESLEGEVITFPKAKLTDYHEDRLKAFLGPNLETMKADELKDSWASDVFGVTVKFDVCRDGFINLIWQDHPKLTKQLKDSGKSDQEIKEIQYGIIFESFSFLKDLIHAHKFHRPDDDRIIIPLLEEDNKDNLWVVKTLRNLHKSIVFSYRNASNQDNLIFALGKLSYLDSFQRIVKSKFGNEIRDDFFINTDSLRTSLELKVRHHAESDKNVNLVSSILGLTLTLLALLIGLNQLLQIPCIEGLSVTEHCKNIDGTPFSFTIPDDAFYTVQFILGNWTRWVLGLPIVAFVIFSYINWNHVERFYNEIFSYKIGRYLRVFYSFAVSESWGRWVAFMFLVFLFILLLLLSVISIGLGPALYNYLF